MSEPERSYEELRIAFEADPEHRNGFITRAVYRGDEASSELSTRHVLPFAPEADASLASLARLLREGRGASRPSSTDVQVVGSALFTALFRDGLARLYRRLVQRTDVVDTRITITFSAASGALVALPWEAMYDETRRDYVALTARITFVRALQGAPSRGLRPTSGRPRMLVLAVDTEDAKLGAQTEVAAIRGVVPDVEVVTNPDPERVLKLLRTTPAEIVHISATLTESDPLRLPLSQADERPFDPKNPAWLPVTHLLVNGGVSPAIQLIYLSACRSMQFATALLDVVPAVVAIQTDILVEDAILCAGAFYQALYAGAALDAAMGAARRTADRASPGKSGWALPILAVRGDGPLGLAAPQIEPTQPNPEVVPDSSASPELLQLQIRKRIAERNLEVLTRLGGAGTLATNLHDREKRTLDELASRMESFRSKEDV